jgi:hypothetical protein
LTDLYIQTYTWSTSALKGAFLINNVLFPVP